jgi:transcriptional regulator of acetoin/glycerol metabolism
VRTITLPFRFRFRTITTYEDNQADIQLSAVEKTAMRKSFENNNNISKTAEELGLSRGALYRRLEKYNIN